MEVITSLDAFIANPDVQWTDLVTFVLMKVGERPELFILSTLVPQYNVAMKISDVDKALLKKHLADQRVMVSMM